MYRFTVPRDIYHGENSLEALKTLKGKRACVCVGGSSMKKYGFLDKVLVYLKDNGMEVSVIDGIEADPSVETVLRGAKQMQSFNPDWIVAIGGGSAIDAAKAMWVKYEHPSITFQEMCQVFKIPPLRKKAKFCAITSTSGTASEVTMFSVITDNEKMIKFPLADYEITPDIAIVDPELTYSMPPRLVALTGMDALTHAIEAYVSTKHSTFSDPLAMYSIKMIVDNIEKSYLGDKKARKIMHDAQCLAGIAFSNALLGITHSMAHKTGAAFSDQGAHVIHGGANAMYLPKVIAYNAKDHFAFIRYKEIADFIKLDGKSDIDKVKNLINKIRDLNTALNIPLSLKNYGFDGLYSEKGFINEQLFLNRLPEIAKNAIEDACTLSNPRIPTIKEMEQLLKCCYYDLEVDF